MASSPLGLPGPQIICACVPVDTTRLRQMAPSVQHMIPKPSIEHAIIQCDGCGVDVWIGPKQLQAARDGRSAKILCFPCVLQVDDVQGAPVISLDPNADNIPRRT